MLLLSVHLSIHSFIHSTTTESVPMNCSSTMEIVVNKVKSLIPQKI